MNEFTIAPTAEKVNLSLEEVKIANNNNDFERFYLLIIINILSFGIPSKSIIYFTKIIFIMSSKIFISLSSSFRHEDWTLESIIIRSNLKALLGSSSKKLLFEIAPWNMKSSEIISFWGGKGTEKLNSGVRVILICLNNRKSIVIFLTASSFEMIWVLFILMFFT